MLKESEWNTINNILIDIYTIKDIEIFSNKIMRIFNMLIPYTKGYFIMLDENGDIVLHDAQCFVNMDNDLKNRYISHYYDKDYLKYLYDISIETVVYRDTDIIDSVVREQTDFYKKFLKPIDIPFGCGILIIHNKKCVGVFNLFRSESLGDFTEKDIYILNIFKKHIENIIFNLESESKSDLLFQKCMESTTEKYGLTERETEVLELICQGLSSEEICDKLTISLSTVKKHSHNLYNKLSVKNKAQAMNIIYKQNN